MVLLVVLVWQKHLIMRSCFRPGLQKDVLYCRTCHAWQMEGKPNQTILPAPLYPVPTVHEVFEHIINDCVGPLLRSKSVHHYLLTMCVTKHIPEAVPLHVPLHFIIVRALFVLPKIIVGGTNFTSWVFSRLLKKLNIKHNLSTPFHPDGHRVLPWRYIIKL